MKAKTRSRFHTHAENRYSVIPTAERLDADPRFNGRGITIAVIDAGFYPHPDLTKPINRIAAYHDVTNPDGMLDPSATPQPWDWHGTQTSVAAAGNGFLSNRRFRGLANESNVLLIKVSENGKITERNIALGLEWVLRNKQNYNIRIASLSLGGDADVSYKDNEVDQLAEQAVSEGMVVVAAAGNSGCTDRHHTVPPANAPSVITVGGYDDGNSFDIADLHLYCSSFGATADGLIKPEIVAPARWVAAPILPRTGFYRKAEALSVLSLAPDYKITELARELCREADLDPMLINTDAATIRAAAQSAIRESKIISTHYQHVDGTSFAAPIVASLVAQMLECNPALTPVAVKNILISTAERIRNAPAIRQGYGKINARAAVAEAGRERHDLDAAKFSAPRMEGSKLVFCYHNDSAQCVLLAADFNNWDPPARLQKEEDGIWRARIEPPPPGKYRYKYIVDQQWIEDPGNGMKEPDSYGGFNSLITLLQ